MRFMWQWEQGSLESVICPGTHSVSPPGPVPAACPVAGTGHSLLLKSPACFKAWSFLYGKLLLFSICTKSFLPNLSNLGNTNSPGIIIKVKNILKCQLHDFSRGMNSSRAKMLLLYGKSFLCLTVISWSSSVLRGRMDPQAVLSVEFCPQNWSKPLWFYTCRRAAGSRAVPWSVVLCGAAHKEQQHDFSEKNERKFSLGMDFLKKPLGSFQASLSRITGICMSVFTQAVTHCNMRNPFPAEGRNTTVTKFPCSFSCFFSLIPFVFLGFFFLVMPILGAGF